MLVSYGGYTYYNFYNSVKVGYKKSSMTDFVDPNLKHFSILLMGIDENDEREKDEGQTRDTSRADSLVYISVNKESERIDMVSIPRDSLSLTRQKGEKGNKGGYFFDKITHSFAYGGSEGTIQSVKNLLNVPVNFYAVINFKAFEQVIDSLGGVELYVPFDMSEQNANGEMHTVELKKGWHVLNGEKALAFARSRYYDSDIERGQRQLQIIHAVIDKAKSLNALTKVNDLIKIVGDNVTHNMNASQIASAASMVATNDMKIYSHRIGGYDVMLGGVYYYYPKPSHLMYISAIINNSLGLPIPETKDILNIYYQGKITPLSRYYSLDTKNNNNKKIGPGYFVNLAPEDQLVNLPSILTREDLKNDPTKSNENKPEDNNENQ